MNGRKKKLTSIEIFAVFLVVVIFACLVVPVYFNVIKMAAQTKALNNAKSMSTVLMQYAVDFEGAYPRYTDPVNKKGDPTSSNEILKTLIPDYLGDEMVFALEGSAWAIPGPDGVIDPDSEKLKAGENGWFYLAGLTNKDNPRWPILVSAPKPDSEANPLFDGTDAKAKGGIWKGRKVIVVRSDGSGRIETTVDSSDTRNRHIPRDDDQECIEI